MWAGTDLVVIAFRDGPRRSLTRWAIFVAGATGLTVPGPMFYGHLYD
jgi:hypothetical protein